MMQLKTELMPHQKAAVEKLKRIKYGALFMEQGTGKSLTVMELARQRLERGVIDHIIWLCPCSAKENIRQEIARHCPEEMESLFTICGIETLSTSVRAITHLHQLTEEKRCFIIIDESLLIKNPRAHRTDNITKISQKCPYRIILNGTPVSRNEADLFAQFFVLDWRILGYKSYYSFAANHLEYDDYGKLRRVLGVDSLTSKISPYTFQIRRSECVELPEKTYSTYTFSMTYDQAEHYYEVADELMFMVDEWDSSTVYRMFSALRAIISGKYVDLTDPEHFKTREFFDDPEKNPRVAALLRILRMGSYSDEKVIIFCEYESEISQLCSILGDEAVRFDGKISLKQRTKNLEKFKNEAQYLIANKQCAGYSLNLQFCHNIIYMSNDWNLGTRLQSEDRVHRIGQTETVSILDLCCEDSIDKAMLRCIARKEGMLSSVKAHIDNKKWLKDVIFGRREQEGENLDDEDIHEQNSSRSDKGAA